MLNRSSLPLSFKGILSLKLRLKPLKWRGTTKMKVYFKELKVSTSAQAELVDITKAR